MKRLPLLLALALPIQAQDFLNPAEPTGTPALEPDKVEGPTKEAAELFREGKHHAAIEAARPLAEKGNVDALFLLAYAAESGQGMEANREEALKYYLQASEKGSKEATYRRALILLNSEDEEERLAGKTALEEAVEGDPGNAGRILGEAWMRGLIDKTPNFDEAVKAWKTSKEAGDQTSLILLARLYSGDFGFADKSDLKQSIALYKEAAALEVPAAYLPLGSRLLNGDPEQRNEEEGRKWLAKAIEAEQFSAYLALGDFEENAKKDPKAALEAYLKGAGKGEVECMLRCARFFYQGLAGDKEPAKGLEWLEKAAEAGSAMANFELARLSSGEEKPNMIKIYMHLLAASKAGLATAQNDLGLLYLSGNLSEADPVAAAAWFTRAAKSGFSAAQNNLATLYERGLGVDTNLNNAGELYGLAANQGHGPATTALARFYAIGIGTKPDLVKAWALASLAIERGDEEAKKLLDEITPRLTPSLAEAAKKELERIQKNAQGTDAAGKPTTTDDKPAEESPAP